MLEKLFFIHNNVTKNIPLNFKRYLYDQIDWDAFHLCITGARGVGKTTMLLQHYQNNYTDIEKCLYISADNLEVAATGLFVIASEYFAMGGKALIIDEIHKHPSWQIELKNIIDTFKDKKILISGSSSLDLKKGKADLSRRLAYYDMKGLSFREYLGLKEKREFPVLKLEDLLTHHSRHAQKISSDFPVLKSFRNYLQSGYYPFFTEGEATYLQKVTSVIEKVLYEDVVAIGNMKPASLTALKKILWLIGTSTPFLTNIEKMSREIGISKEYVYNYLEYLEMAGLIMGLRPNVKGFRLIRKPTKLLLENTNLLHAINAGLHTESETGTIRETFFANQLRNVKKVSIAEVGDFLIDGRITFEVGGKGKTDRQIKNRKDSYIVADRMEIGSGNKIPLYLFGFLY